MGAIKRIIEVQERPEKAFEIFTSVLNNIGTLKNTNNISKEATGKMKYGLQTVPIKIRILNSENDKTTFEILAWSDDIWSKGAKNSLERIINHYKNPSKTVGEKDLIGMKPIYLAIIITSFYYILEQYLIPNIENVDILNYLSIFGGVPIIYYIISRIRFNNL